MVSNNNSSSDYPVTTISAGFVIENVNNSIIENNLAKDNKLGGFIFQNCNNLIIKNNTAINDFAGFDSEFITNCSYIDNYAEQNGAVGFSFEYYIKNINFSHNIAFRNGFLAVNGLDDGTRIQQISDSTLVNNCTIQNSNNGFSIGTLPGDIEPGPSNNNTIIGNSAIQNNNTFNGNNMDSNGFIFFNMQISNLINNTSNNNNYGFTLLYCSKNNLINNSAFNNKKNDFSEDSNSNKLRNNSFSSPSNSLSTSSDSFSINTFFTFIILLIVIICILVCSYVFVSMKKYRNQLLLSNLDNKNYPFPSYLKEQIISFRKKTSNNEAHPIINETTLEKNKEIIQECENDQIPK